MFLHNENTAGSIMLTSRNCKASTCWNKVIVKRYCNVVCLRAVQLFSEGFCVLTTSEGEEAQTSCCKSSIMLPANQPTPFYATALFRDAATVKVYEFKQL